MVVANRHSRPGEITAHGISPDINAGMIAPFRRFLSQSCPRSALLLVLLGGLASLAGCGQSGSDEESAIVIEVPPAKVTTLELQPRDIVFTTRVVASVEPWHSVEVSAERGGRVERLEFDTSDKIEMGQLLVTVDMPLADIGVRDASAALELARAAVKKAESFTRPQELLISEALRSRAEAQYDLSQKDFDRINRLLASQNASQSQYDASKAELDVASRDLEAVRQRLVLAQEGARDEDIAIARAQLDQAHVALDRAYDQRQKAIVIAPLSGHIARRHIEIGEVVNIGTPIATMVDISRVKVVGSVAQEEVALLRKGESAEVHLDAFPGDVLNGTIHTIDWVGDDRSRTFRVEVAVENPELRIRPGMMGRVVFRTGAQEGALLVGAAHLWERNGTLGVFVANDGLGHFRPVQLGRYVGDDVIVHEGLRPSDRIIVTAPEGLADRQPIQEIATDSENE